MKEVMSAVLTTSQPCQVHYRHMPVSHLNHHHHVWPLSLGGPATADNVIIVCPTGHYNIHTLLDKYLSSSDGHVEWTVARGFGRWERQFARLGYNRYIRGSL